METIRVYLYIYVCMYVCMYVCVYRFGYIGVIFHYRFRLSHNFRVRPHCDVQQMADSAFKRVYSYTIK